MTSKFEQLIEYVINDEEAKAKELFHDIVVEKSREIYENLMDEDAAELEEAEELDEESTHDEDDKAEKAGEKVTKDIEYDDKKDKKMDESMDEMMSDQDPIDAVEAEETGMDMAEGEGEEDLEDRVVDLEDKLDELMAEFEALMGDQGEADADTEMDMEVDSDAGMTDIEVADDEMETEGMMKMPMEEAINLKAAPAPVKSEEAGVNKKSTVAANSGAVGAAAQPVKMTGDVAQGRPAPSTKDLIGKVQNTPAQSTVKQEPATKPHLAQATGVNTKTPFPKQ
jgi:hypothetical protein